MSARFKIVDLFAGPGGLAEGFSSVRNQQGQRVFDIVLSVEKDPAAYRTLRLRSFFRQFTKAPVEYYSYIAGEIGVEGLIGAYPQQWARAEEEARLLELGTADAQTELDPILEKLSDSEELAVLIGGPPCQAYSLVGRARNKGVAGYNPEKDNRHFLYQEYIRIIGKLKPAIFVMENVKGILSSKIGRISIFSQVIADLKAAGGAPDSYRLIPVVRTIDGEGSGFVVRCEQFGIPQARHRVFIVGVRRDLASALSERDQDGLLSISSAEVTVQDVIGDMPELRSGLSREIDGPEHWRRAASESMLFAARACTSSNLADVASSLKNAAKLVDEKKSLPERRSAKLTRTRNFELGEWFGDPDLKSLPNHETRAHMREDLARYAFAAAFAEVHGRSPKAIEFPDDLAPRHDNWKTGKFADRFRVQLWNRASTTVTSHISKDGHYFIHPDITQCRSLTVREAARLQTFPDNYFFEGNRTEQFGQVGNAVPPLIAKQLAHSLLSLLTKLQHAKNTSPLTNR